ncbi:MFS transporter [Arthrobacter silvisoli]|uniref:MFS transporter n=1 Tax=Arthrobacter silvisoli TaxID=2291022 RepID=UPI001FE91B7A|nr:MFS transporter [Arthrobacter silvisoli]
MGTKRQGKAAGAKGAAGWSVVAVLAALLMVSVNLRPAITTLAGAMGKLEDGFGVDRHLLPALGALPVLAFGISAPLGPWLAKRLGSGWAVAVALLVLAAALVARALVPGFIFPGTFFAGSAIMAASVLLPQIVKEYHGSGWWTGLCTMGFGLGAALGAGLVQPLQAALGGSLAGALAVWAVPAVIGALMVGSAVRQGPVRQGPVRQGPVRAVAAATSSGGPAAADAPGEPARRSLRTQRTAWAVAAFFGLQALLYFAVTSWLAVFLESKGLGPAEAAALLAWFSIAGLPAGLLVPVLAGRPAVLRIMAPGLGVLIAAALLGVLVAPAGLQFPLIGILGFVQSAPFGLGMALIVIRSSGPRTAGRLSAMSQGLGFAVASLGPLAAGLLHEWSGAWTPSFVMLAAVALLVAAAGFFAVNGPVVDAGEAVEHEKEPAAVGR